MDIKLREINCEILVCSQGPLVVRGTNAWVNVEFGTSSEAVAAGDKLANLTDVKQSILLTLFTGMCESLMHAITLQLEGLRPRPLPRGESEAAKAAGSTFTSGTRSARPGLAPKSTGNITARWESPR